MRLKGKPARRIAIAGFALAVFATTGIVLASSSSAPQAPQQNATVALVAMTTHAKSSSVEPAAASWATTPSAAKKAPACKKASRTNKVFAPYVVKSKKDAWKSPTTGLAINCLNGKGMGIVTWAQNWTTFQCKTKGHTKALLKCPATASNNSVLPKGELLEFKGDVAKNHHFIMVVSDADPAPFCRVGHLSWCRNQSP